MSPYTELSGDTVFVEVVFVVIEKHFFLSMYKKVTVLGKNPGGTFF